MGNEDREIRRKLFEVFRIESQEQLRILSHGLIELEQLPADQRPTLFERMFRAAHNLKGASAAVNQDAVESVCQAVEGIIASWKEGRFAADKGHFDALHHALDTIDILLDEQIVLPDAPPVKEALSRLSAIFADRPQPPPDTKDSPAAALSPGEVRGTPPSSPPSPPAPADQTLGTVRLSAAQIDLLLRESEEMLSVQTVFAGSLEELQAVAWQLRNWKNELADRERAPSLAAGAADHEKFAEWMEWNETQIALMQESINRLLSSLRQQSASFTALAHRHLQNMKEASLLPFSMLTDPLRKTVRDLLGRQQKEASLEIVGEEIEIDRRILQELKAPLLHLLRNAVDHGLETPEERLHRGKSAGGRISLQMRRLDSARFQIVVADDGNGIDLRNVRQSAVEKRIATEEELAGMSRSEILSLIFRSGVSTRRDVTAISGRGVGMAIVREAVEGLSGQVWVESEYSRGTTFYLELPTTISTMRALRIRLRDRHFMLPTAFIVQALRVLPDMVQTIGSRDTIAYAGETIALMDLGQIFGLGAPKESGGAGMQALIVQSSGKRIGLLVDRILDEREVLVKNLGPQLERVHMIAGGTIHSNGEVVPVLNITDLLGLEHSRRTDQPAAPAVAPRRARHSILVVEDSITSRTLLKSILESAGYAVRTAKDGAEALAALKTESFDLVVSDVDMPRMDGFELTRSIRSNAALADLPVILVTALESQRDRESGIEAGASAYIVKSKFDNMNLLQTIQRLI